MDSHKPTKTTQSGATVKASRGGSLPAKTITLTRAELEKSTNPAIKALLGDAIATTETTIIKDLGRAHPGETVFAFQIADRNIELMQFSDLESHKDKCIDKIQKIYIQAGINKSQARAKANADYERALEENRKNTNDPFMLEIGDMGDAILLWRNTDSGFKQLIDELYKKTRDSYKDIYLEHTMDTAAAEQSARVLADKHLDSFLRYWEQEWVAPVFKSVALPHTLKASDVSAFTKGVRANNKIKSSHLTIHLSPFRLGMTIEEGHVVLEDTYGVKVGEIVNQSHINVSFDENSKNPSGLCVPKVDTIQLSQIFIDEHGREYQPEKLLLKDILLNDIPPDYTFDYRHQIIHGPKIELLCPKQKQCEQDFVGAIEDLKNFKSDNPQHQHFYNAIRNEYLNTYLSIFDPETNIGLINVTSYQVLERLMASITTTIEKLKQSTVDLESIYYESAEACTSTALDFLKNTRAAKYVTNPMMDLVVEESQKHYESLRASRRYDQMPALTKTIYSTIRAFKDPTVENAERMIQDSKHIHGGNKLKRILGYVFFAIAIASLITLPLTGGLSTFGVALSLKALAGLYAAAAGTMVLSSVAYYKVDRVNRASHTFFGVGYEIKDKAREKARTDARKAAGEERARKKAEPTTTTKPAEAPASQQTTSARPRA